MDLETLYRALRTISPILLYAFIGLILFVLWQDIKSARRLISLTTKPAGEIVELTTKQSHPLMPVTSLGRATTNVISVADSAISLEHALITRRDGAWWLEDLDSRNGTHLNGQSIEIPAVITSGDIITLGHYRFKISIGPATI
jgi:pSer/pThr/pTyr-binding forkhead associated (FHA) protein